MGAWDYTPSSSGRMKPVTKAQLRKMQDNYARAQSIAEQTILQEKKEQEKISIEVDDMIENVF